ncbi:oligopeptide transport system substrate-binding protein [Scopulibacillus daqui]|uniref:Oligopeptide transport system substrate-binding protein n=1 Tax=Scopulibacillus daqui TaxID=1469162 RepID=A0ABS2PVM6_9BACL|nr:peptide ABC transporter substrate-binding protein [Scopulibacillus daqui]MBM7644018.1 oligopeptide transport system substrate-binding protein [Scopulibacillus daqui]
MKGKKTKWPLALSFILVLSLFLSACSSGSKDTSGTNAGGDGQLSGRQVLNLTTEQDIPSLNWTQASDTTSLTVLSMVGSGLMRMDQELKPKPDMAAAMPKVSNDKKVYTFKIRSDAKWSDGSPVTANDFVYAWRKMNDPKTAAQYGYIFPAANIKNAAKIQDPKDPLFGKVDQLGVKALDDKTLQVTLDKPTPYFLSLTAFFAFFPAKKDFVEKQGKKYGQEVNNILYNGPYVLSGWQHGAGWTYKKNNKYWNAKNIHIQQVNYKVIKDGATAVNMYKTGKLDSATITSEFVNPFKGKKDLQTVLQAPVNFLRLNEEKVPEFKNKNLRKAIYMSIDRESMAKELLNDGSLPAAYIVPKDFTKGPNGKDFRSEKPDGYPIGSKQDAKKYWEKAKKELGIKTLKLDLMSQDSDNSTKYNEYIANQIEKNLPGITVTVSKQPKGNFLNKEKSGDYQMSSNNWVPDYQDPMTFLDMWTKGNPSNREGFYDPKYDKLIKEAENLGGQPEKRWEKLHEAEKVLLEDDAAIVPLYQAGNAILTKPYVKGLLHPNFGLDVDWTHAEVLKH